MLNYRKVPFAHQFQTPLPHFPEKKIVGGEDLRLGSTKQFIDVAMARKLSQVCSVYVMTRVYIKHTVNK